MEGKEEEDEEGGGGGGRGGRRRRREMKHAQTGSLKHVCVLTEERGPGETILFPNGRTLACCLIGRRCGFAIAIRQTRQPRSRSVTGKMKWSP